MQVLYLRGIGVSVWYSVGPKSRKELMNRLLVPALLLLALSVPAMAELKIGVVNPSRILREMKETKDVEQSLSAERDALQAQANEKTAKIAKLEDDRKQVKPDAPQWAELNRQIVSLRSEFEGWKKIVDEDLGRKMRDQSLKLYGKIRDAINEVSKAENLDIVLSEQSEMPDGDVARIPPMQLLGALFSNKQVIFRKDSLDITDKVIAKLDSGYTPAAK